MSNKDSGHTARDEHNDKALAKRTLGVGFDYENGKYVVTGVDADGVSTVKDARSILIEERLVVIEKTMRLLLIHAEFATGETYTEEDLE